MKTPRTLTHPYAGAGWIRASLKVEMSPLGVLAADMLGLVFRGIYHLNSTSLRKVDWTETNAISVVLRDDLATFDGNKLTELVVLAHDLAVRVDIDAAAPGYVRVFFHAREHERADLGMWARHPTIEDATAQFRTEYSVTFEEPSPAGTP